MTNPQPNLQILSQSQVALLPLVKSFRQSFYLVGGTAIALHLGHRRSIDFDLFSPKTLQKTRLYNRIKAAANIDRVLVMNSQEMTLYVNQVKMTWYCFKYPVKPALTWPMARVPSLLTLGAMKLFAMGKRAKWKDYVDIYQILHHHTFTQLCDEADKLLGGEFNAKLARVQLSYYDDVNYSEQVEWLPGFETDPEDIKSFLVEESLKI